MGWRSTERSRWSSPSADLMDVEHLAGAVGADNRGRTTGYGRGCTGCRGRVNHPGAVGLHVGFDKGEEGALLGMEEAVGPHLLDAAWQHMLKKPADEPFGGERPDPRGI